MEEGEPIKRGRQNRAGSHVLKLRAKARTVAIICAVVVAFLWALYAVRVLTGVDLIHEIRSSHSVAPPEVYLGIAIAGTLGAAIYSAVKLAKINALARRGIPVAGTVVKVGVLTRNGRSPVTVSYKADGRDYTIRRDLERSSVADGATVWVVYDPQSPSRCELIP